MGDRGVVLSLQFSIIPTGAAAGTFCPIQSTWCRGVPDSTIRLFLLQMEHAFLGIYVHAEIAQEVEA